MKNLKFKTLFALYGLVLLSCLVQSCCEEEYIITSSGGGMSARLVHEYGEIYKITSEFILDVYFYEKQISHQPISLISSSYATSCKETMLNTIDKSSLNLFFDKAFLFEGDTIPAHTNLLELQDAGIELQSMARNYVKFHFTEAFFSNATFENGNWLFTLQGVTNDGVQLHSEKTFEMEL